MIAHILTACLLVAGLPGIDDETDENERESEKPAPLVVVIHLEEVHPTPAPIAAIRRDRFIERMEEQIEKTEEEIEALREHLEAVEDGEEVGIPGRVRGDIARHERHLRSLQRRLDRAKHDGVEPFIARTIHRVHVWDGYTHEQHALWVLDDDRQTLRRLRPGNFAEIEIVPLEVESPVNPPIDCVGADHQNHAHEARPIVFERRRPEGFRPVTHSDAQVTWRREAAQPADAVRVHIEQDEDRRVSAMRVIFAHENCRSMRSVRYHLYALDAYGERWQRLSPVDGRVASAIGPQPVIMDVIDPGRRYAFGFELELIEKEPAAEPEALNP